MDFSPSPRSRPYGETNAAHLKTEQFFPGSLSAAAQASAPWNLPRMLKRHSSSTIMKREKWREEASVKAGLVTQHPGSFPSFLTKPLLIPNTLPEEERAPEAIHEPERHEGHTPSRTIPDVRTNLFPFLPPARHPKPPKRDSAPSAITLTKAYSWLSPSSIRTPFSSRTSILNMFLTCRGRKITPSATTRKRAIRNSPADILNGARQHPSILLPGNRSTGLAQEEKHSSKREKTGELTYSAPK